MTQQQMISWIFPILLILFFYFFLIRPQRKKEKAIDAMRKSVKAGDKVITIGGIRGRVVKEREETLILEIGEKTRIEVMRWSVSSVVESAPKKKTVLTPPEEKEDKTPEASEESKAPDQNQASESQQKAQDENEASEKAENETETKQ